MTGGTPLFTASPVASIRSLAGALLLLALVAIVLLETYGESRYGPEPELATVRPISETAVIEWQFRLDVE